MPFEYENHFALLSVYLFYHFYFNMLGGHKRLPLSHRSLSTSQYQAQQFGEILDKFGSNQTSGRTSPIKMNLKSSYHPYRMLSMGQKPAVACQTRCHSLPMTPINDLASSIPKSAVANNLFMYSANDVSDQVLDYLMSDSASFGRQDDEMSMSSLASVITSNFGGMAFESSAAMDEEALLESLQQF